jgi:pimeloyl-ACP methyl ester carboxylesterase
VGLSFARRALALVVALTTVFGLVAAVPAAAEPGGVTRYEGEIDGAKYLVQVPDDWNGTLVLWSHGTYSLAFPEPTRIALTSQPATEPYLLEQGYALAASQFRTVRGWSIEEALTDQVRLLDWFGRTIGKPHHTISAGESAGAITATLLAERNPRRFDAVMTFCGTVAGGAALWNSGLDLGFVLNTLLGSDVELVRITDPAANVTKFIDLVATADDTPAGRARLALANAVAEIPGWADSTQPRPTDTAEQVFWQGVWDRFFRPGAFGIDRVDLERRAGGNPSWNTGVNYGRMLANSSERGLVQQAYADAGLDLRADLDRLANAPRIAPDVRAVTYLAKFGLPVGQTPWPVLTMHTVADGTAPAAHERTYADRVARLGEPRKLKQLFVNRAGHCIFTSSEEITAFRTLVRRMESGHWPATDPSTLNGAAGQFGPEHQLIFDILNGVQAPANPAFTTFAPVPFPRVLPF